jgi:hypothetical protein
VTSPVSEVAALAIDPASGDFLVVDTLSSGRRLKRLQRQGSALVLVSDRLLPSTVFGFADAGLAYNPFTGRFAIAGELAAMDGLIFEVDAGGTRLRPYFETGLGAGISGIAFDEPGRRMFVLTRLAGKRVLVYTRERLR